MHVILTHEQADFDALGALLGAYLQHENALPVLPRRINRNGRAFLNLYGAELPFIDPRDLPPAPVETITLVDTQSLITLKGAGERTQVQVIDHHPLRSDLPENWSPVYVPTGAVTTLFVETLQEHNSALSQVQATLLLLAIYEDTGSLSYSSTTARDVRAAAYLLEQGASLQIATRYLNPPLSPPQRQLYDRLLASTETYQISGQRIVVACGLAEDMNEEISSVAHKLRDLLDPDALLMLVTTNEGIRLVARSNTPRVNVAEIAAAFGGGGHERASAALIRFDDLEKPGETATNHTTLLNRTCQELTNLLPRYVRPTIVVGQIMSRRPRLVSPKTPAEEAAQLMQRYGYEGYPVVENDRVIGLLTRRAVDRAISHRLNLTAESLMEAGEVTVQPGDSLDHLQQVMTSSGWGQIPVQEPETGKIIGIVTRTDLIKTLADQSQLPTRQNLASKLEAALPPARLSFLKAVAEKAHEQRLALYIVGGFVRDLLLDRPSLDFDLVVEGDAIQLARSLSAQYGGQIISHARFGTAKWDISDLRDQLANKLTGDGQLNPEDIPESLDLISARTEFYEHPTALPTVERSSIKHDLHRRDFTINTLAMRLDGRHYGELHDYWGGLNDLRLGLVRVLHSLSFIDDPTRLLRAVRFEQRFGFQIEARTLQLMKEAGDLLKQVSGDRIRHELDLILAEKNAQAMLSRLAELGILRDIHPGLPVFLDPRVSQLPGPEWGIGPKYNGIPIGRFQAYLVWLVSLSEPQAYSVSKRLRFPGTLCEALLAAIHLRQDLPNLAGQPPSEIVARLENVPLPSLYAVYRTVSDDRTCGLIDQYIREWQHIKSKVNGDMLQGMGIPPGPAYRHILNGLRKAWLDGEIKTHEQEQNLLKKLLNEVNYGRSELAR